MKALDPCNNCYSLIITAMYSDVKRTYNNCYSHEGREVKGTTKREDPINILSALTSIATGLEDGS